MADKKSTAEKDKAAAEQKAEAVESKNESKGKGGSDKPLWNRATHGDPPAGREGQYEVV